MEVAGWWWAKIAAQSLVYNFIDWNKYAEQQQDGQITALNRQTQLLEGLDEIPTLVFFPLHQQKVIPYQRKPTGASQWAPIREVSQLEPQKLEGEENICAVGVLEAESAQNQVVGRLALRPQFGLYCTDHCF